MIRAKDNPFAVQCWEALGYLMPSAEWESLLDRLQAADYTAAIIGPHGSGKTTLLRHLERRLRENGLATESLFTSCDIRLPWRTICDRVASMGPDSVLCFDGAGHLARWRFGQLRRLTRRRRIGLLITSHRAGRLATLTRCQPTPELLAMIVRRLLPDNESIEPQKLTLLFNANRGNIRECLWQLYDDYADLG